MRPTSAFLVLALSLLFAGAAPVDSCPDLRVFFGPAREEDPQGLFFGLSNAILSARRSVRIAAHEFDLEGIAALLERRKGEGIDVEIVVEEKWKDRPGIRLVLDRLRSAGVPVHAFRSSGLMHHKFAVFDLDSVWTGSANWTASGFFRNDNDAVHLRSPEVAAAFLTEWSRLVHPGFRKGSRHEARWIPFRGGRAAVAFAGQGDGPGGLLEWGLSSAKMRVDFGVFAFSDPRLAGILTNRIRAGAVVRGVFEDDFESEAATRAWQGVPFQILWTSGGEVRYDGLPSRVHHKLACVDDRLWVTGSANWSRNADRRNLENAILLEAPPAIRVRERLEALFARSPIRTPYEKWLRASLRRETLLSWEETLRREEAERLDAFHRSRMAGLWRVEGVDGPLAFRVKGTALRLAGLLPPDSGWGDRNQEPWLSLARQRTLRLLCGATLRLKSASPGGCAVWAWREGAVKSVQEELLDTGLFRIAAGEDSVAPEVPEPALAKAMAVAEAAAPRPAGFLHPRAFRRALEKDRLEESRWIARLALTNARGAVLAVHPLQRTVCRPGSREWAKAILPGSKGWLFFATEEDARRCGFDARPTDAEEE